MEEIILSSMKKIYCMLRYSKSLVATHGQMIRWDVERTLIELSQDSEASERRKLTMTHPDI